MQQREITNAGRIDYIDAMRGFTMILVVYSHVCGWCLGDRYMGGNQVLFLFRLPCFFFISGWLFEKPGRLWTKRRMRATVSDKFRVEIVPTVIFLLLLAPPPLFFSRLGATKGGYWFTFALFVFFLLHMFIMRVARHVALRWREPLFLTFALLISFSAFWYDANYHRFSLSPSLSPSLKIFGFLSFVTWRYFLFFYIGSVVKRHFDTFLRCTNRWWVLVFTFFGFSVFALMLHSDSIFMEYLRFSFGGIFGLVLVFTFFRVFAGIFSKKQWLGRSLIYVGRRTLDIYLLHYFFLPRFLVPYGNQLRMLHQPMLELLVPLAIALVVVMLCLLVSSVLRLSPFLGKWLFGAKDIRVKP
jgi:fucose 4-O-acetylase-like acetyltransferase